MIKVLFVCHGNTCRSPMAESIFTYLIKGKGLETQFRIRSAGVNPTELGVSPSYGTYNVLKEKDIPLVPHKTQQVFNWDYNDYDYLIGMDSSNVMAMQRIFVKDPKNKIYRLLDFTNSSGDVPDPMYTHDYVGTFEMISKGVKGFFDYLVKNGKVKLS